ncbi:MAG: hypothetical protein ACKV0T_30445 [Planctomycetales bacterium]
MRLIWFVMGAAIPYLGWTVYRWTAEPPLLSAHARLMTLLIAGDSERAYRLTTDEYQAKHSDLEFQSAFGHMRGDDLWGKSASVISMGVDSAQVYCRPDPGFLEWLSGPIYHYVREQGEWRFTGKVEHPVD